MNRPDWKAEKKLNKETFGVAGGGYGGWRRGYGYRGGNRGYRGGGGGGGRGGYRGGEFGVPAVVAAWRRARAGLSVPLRKPPLAEFK